AKNTHLKSELNKMKEYIQNRESDLVAKNTILEELNQEAELRLMTKFAENQRLVAYYKYLFNNGQKPSNEDFEKLKLIFDNLENETQQKVYQIGL
ncbi:17390_t:CDS:2, partial [Dentiscutata erythropus]